MPHTAPRYLYLARHGEATEDESSLTPDGRRQAELLGDRLRDSLRAPLAAIHHGPLPRAAQTARLIGDRLGSVVPLRRSELAGDYVPYLPQKEELPPDAAGTLLAFLAQFPEDELRTGPELAREAIAEFTGPVDGDLPRHELVVTHAFLVAWLVRAALDAPEWRWMGVNQGNAALTVIRYAPGRPPAVLVHNDMRHLPAELRWTGFSPELHV